MELKYCNAIETKTLFNQNQYFETQKVVLGKGVSLVAQSVKNLHAIW